MRPTDALTKFEMEWKSLETDDLVHAAGHMLIVRIWYDMALFAAQEASSDRYRNKSIYNHQVVTVAHVAYIQLRHEFQRLQNQLNADIKHIDYSMEGFWTAQAALLELLTYAPDLRPVSYLPDEGLLEEDAETIRWIRNHAEESNHPFVISTSGFTRRRLYDLISTSTELLMEYNIRHPDGGIPEFSDAETTRVFWREQREVPFAPPFTPPSFETHELPPLATSEAAPSNTPPLPPIAETSPVPEVESTTSVSHLDVLLGGLSRQVEAARQLEAETSQTAQSAIEAGATWEQVAKAAGISRTAAYRRWKPGKAEEHRQQQQRYRDRNKNDQADS